MHYFNMEQAKSFNCSRTFGLFTNCRSMYFTNHYLFHRRDRVAGLQHARPRRRQPARRALGVHRTHGLCSICLLYQGMNMSYILTCHQEEPTFEYSDMVTDRYHHHTHLHVFKQTLTLPVRIGTRLYLSSFTSLYLSIPLLPFLLLIMI